MGSGDQNGGASLSAYEFSPATGGLPTPKRPSLAWVIVFGVWGALGITIAKSVKKRSYSLGRYWAWALAPTAAVIAIIVVVGLAAGSSNTSAGTNAASAPQITQAVPAAGPPIPDGPQGTISGPDTNRGDSPTQVADHLLNNLLYSYWTSPQQDLRYLDQVFINGGVDTYSKFMTSWTSTNQQYITYKNYQFSSVKAGSSFNLVATSYVTDSASSTTLLFAPARIKMSFTFVDELGGRWAISSYQPLSQ